MPKISQLRKNFRKASRLFKTPKMNASEKETLFDKLVRSDQETIDDLDRLVDAVSPKPAHKRVNHLLEQLLQVKDL